MHQCSHSILGLNPRTARHRPTSTVLHRESQPKAATLLGCMLYGLVPVLAQTLNILGRCRPLTTKLTVKELNARDASPSDSLQVGRNTLVRYISTDIMEPRLGVVYFIWRDECLAVVLTEWTLHLLLRGHNIYNRAIITTLARCKHHGQSCQCKNKPLHIYTIY